MTADIFCIRIITNGYSLKIIYMMHVSTAKSRDKIISYWYIVGLAEIRFTWYASTLEMIKYKYIFSSNILWYTRSKFAMYLDTITKQATLYIVVIIYLYIEISQPWGCIITVYGRPLCNESYIMIISPLYVLYTPVYVFALVNLANKNTN